MSEADRFLDAAERYARGFDKGDLASPPARRVAVLTCMDARINPYALLGLSEGEAHVIRNAGGVVSEDAIRSISISQHLLGSEEIVLIHHTRCGLLDFSDEDYAARMESEAGERPAWSAHAFDDLEADLRAGAERLRSSPFVPRTDALRGFVYEVESGRLREVELTARGEPG